MNGVSNGASTPIPHNSHNQFPGVGKYGPNKATTAGPETLPNRNTQQLQSQQRQNAKDLEALSTQQSQLDSNALPQQGPTSAAAAQQTSNQNVNTHQHAQRVAASAVRA